MHVLESSTDVTERKQTEAAHDNALHELESLQAKLLRVLQEDQFERVSGSHTLPVDVRIIATINRKLKDETVEGRFRSDLFYRLKVYPLTAPPLRDRREDIPLLVQYFVAQIASGMGKKLTRRRLT